MYIYIYIYNFGCYHIIWPSCTISFIAVKDFSSALQAFLQAICAPANNLSQIVISAIKKARLISLIHNGQPFHIPK